ncbi:MAG: hypothetical protein AAGF20_02255 [Pseudomonadota bacterium]
MTRFALLMATSISFGLAILLAASADETVSFEAIDINADGLVSEPEYVSWRTADGSVTAMDAAVEFAILDVDASGALEEAELAETLGADDAAATEDVGDEIDR